MNHLLYKTFLFLSFLSVGCATEMYAVIQQTSKGMITGRVIDSQSEPYYPVAVSIEGLLMGGYTNEKGNFRINDIPVGDHTLVVSGLGVKTKKVPVKIVAGKLIDLGDIEIDTHVEQLDEIQVLGKSEARRQQEQAYAISVLDIKKAYSGAAPLNKLLNNVSSVRIRDDGGVRSNYNF